MIPEYYAWYNMHKRCYDDSALNYYNYGGRGIQVCPRWHEYKNFLADMGRRPSKFMSLDRVDNNGNYAPENCRWATSAQQTENRRDNGVHRRQKNNSSGIIGVTYAVGQRRWAAIVRTYGSQERLYWGLDFFEACCARKSWEAQNAR